MHKSSALYWNNVVNIIKPRHHSRCSNAVFVLWWLFIWGNTRSYKSKCWKHWKQRKSIFEFYIDYISSLEICSAFISIYINSAPLYIKLKAVYASCIALHDLKMLYLCSLYHCSVYVICSQIMEVYNYLSIYYLTLWWFTMT